MIEGLDRAGQPPHSKDCFGEPAIISHHALLVILLRVRTGMSSVAIVKAAVEGISMLTDLDRIHPGGRAEAWQCECLAPPL